MEYAFTDVDGDEGILLSGRFTYDDSRKFHDMVADWDFGRRPDVRLDFRYLTFLDSTAIGMLFILANRARDAHGSVTVLNAQPYIVQTMKRVSLDQYVFLR
ncbi:anti-anti-sigma regulatory factor [Azospirillum fermentarium]|uniref:STAS domain-containing protein n=1 Tax=Azospirillum fermentarium TaxID=1233114 RepID=UPI00222742BD|nr:STAS domain-containing protein [Azospirillum fermentarium]MCW2245732.1 anti-anti-sigma regulatory factor [Azospirillum fermentarium]